jgi:cytochrome c-type biogenesis protein CcmH/NrfF
MIQKTLSNKLWLVLVLLCLFQSCRKDNEIPQIDSLNEKQLIKQEELLKFIENSKPLQLLSLNWSKAQQTTIGNKKIIRVPTLRENNVSILYESKGLKLNKMSGVEVEKGVKSNTNENSNTSSTNFYEKHPPEVFFIQQIGTQKTHSFLLNFVPNTPNREFGDNGLWTGKLFEWNLSGDTVLVQDINKSKLLERYAIKPISSNTTSSYTTTPQLVTLNDKKTSNFWSDLWDALADFVGWVGSLFGLSDYHSGWNGDTFDEDGGWRLNLNFDWLTGDGGGGGNSSGSSQGPTYTGSGYPIYDSYIPGYQAPDGGSSGGSSTNSWDPYPNSGGGNNNGTTHALPVYSTSVSYLMNYIDFTTEQLDFLAGRDDVAQALETYLETNGTTADNIAFADWSAQYLQINPTESFSSLIKGDGNYFVMDLASQTSYPRFTQMVKELKTFVKNDQKVLDALMKWSGFSESEILEKLTFGKGPKIVIKEMTDDYGNFNRYIDPNVINISASWVRGLEASNLLGTKQATGFLLAVTVLHEFVHQARATNGLDTRSFEYGVGFENSAFGLIIGFDNAGKYSYRFYGK